MGEAERPEFSTTAVMHAYDQVTELREFVATKGISRVTSDDIAELIDATPEWRDSAGEWDHAKIPAWLLLAINDS